MNTPVEPVDDIKSSTIISSDSRDDTQDLSSPSSPSAKRSKGGILLVPQPSEDPRDPLNWSTRRKLSILATLCLTSFAAIAGPLAGLLAFGPQATLYDKSLVEISYSVSAALAAMVTGPFFIVPLANKFGRSSILFWCTFSVLICNVWAACMTKPNQYIAFVMSRLLSGFGATVPSVLGNKIITDLFFIHERGRAFSIFHLCFLFGPVGAPTIGGFIAAHVSWTVMFWWTIGLLGLSLILLLCFMEETGFSRDKGNFHPGVTESFVANRLTTFFPGNKVVPQITGSQLVTTITNPFIICVTPVTIIIGLFAFISFGLQLMLSVLQNVFIQKPVFIGGLGKSLEWNAFYSFSSWAGLIAAQAYGHLVNDRLPLWMCKRRGGIWKPEYRLQCLWFPALVMLPIGLGLFGAALQYQLHFMVLALGTFLTVFGSMASAPILTNYLIECFTHLPSECAVVMNFYRLTLGLTTSFYINQWVAAVGNGWVFGMSAFFCIFSFVFVMLLMWKGHSVRQIQFKHLASSEEGTKLIEVDGKTNG